MNLFEPAPGCLPPRTSTYSLRAGRFVVFLLCASQFIVMNLNKQANLFENPPTILSDGAGSDKNG